MKIGGMNLGLNRIKEALRILGNPSSSIPAIHIAGTNGKGSIATFIQSTLSSSGIRNGLTTSPHLISWRERISVNGKLISYENFINILEVIIPQIKHLNLTTFELVITTALIYFEESNLDIIILETGLGGRLDATTAHPFRPIIGIGGIGLDHCDHLGSTLREITQEKAEIITSGSIIISSNQHPEVKEILEKIARKKKAMITWIKPLDNKWKLGINGEIQRENAAVAKAILEEISNLGFFIDRKDIKNGLSSAKWKGRMQSVTWEGLPLLLDGAHNEHACMQLSKERNTWPGNELGVKWLLAIQKNKNGPSILKQLIQKNDKAWIIEVPKHKSWNASELKIICNDLSSQIYHAENIMEALLSIKSENKWPKPKPIIAGSLYLIGHLLENNIVCEESS